MSKGQGLTYNFIGLSLKIIMFKFEENPFNNNKVTANNSNNKQIWIFDLEGQGYLWMKVKVSVVY
jgi:hypothetical protein